MYDSIYLDDCRIIRNNFLYARLRSRFHGLMAKIYNGIPLYPSLFFYIIIDDTHIGRTTAHISIRYYNPDFELPFPSEYEVVTPIFFKNCKNVEDVIDAYTIDSPPVCIMSDSFVAPVVKPDALGGALYHHTDLLVRSLLDSKIISNTSPEYIMYNLLIPESETDDIYVVYQKRGKESTKKIFKIGRRMSLEPYYRKKKQGIFDFLFNIFNPTKHLKID